MVLPDHTRCDCLTRTHAIEFDFGNNWAEAIGQSLYYSIQTGKKAGIALILEKPSDYKYWIRLNTVIAKIISKSIHGRSGHNNIESKLQFLNKILFTPKK